MVDINVDLKEPEHQPSIGYPWELLVEPEQASVYQCKSCDDLPREPYELECGHGSCCRTCKHRVVCHETPECRNMQIERMPARDRKKVKALMMMCLRHEVGCDAQVKVSDWDDHVTNQCLYRLEQCDQCNEKYRLVNKDHHMNTGKHYTCDLAKYEMNCPAQKMTQEEHANHRQAEYLNHIDVIAETLADSKRVLTDRIDQLTDTNNHLREEIETLRTEGQDKDREISRLKKELQKVMEQMESFNRRILGCEFAAGIIDELPVD